MQYSCCTLATKVQGRSGGCTDHDGGGLQVSGALHNKLLTELIRDMNKHFHTILLAELYYLWQKCKAEQVAAQVATAEGSGWAVRRATSYWLNWLGLWLSVPRWISLNILIAMLTQKCQVHWYFIIVHIFHYNGSKILNLDFSMLTSMENFGVCQKIILPKMFNMRYASIHICT